MAILKWDLTVVFQNSGYTYGTLQKNGQDTSSL